MQEYIVPHPTTSTASVYEKACAKKLLVSLRVGKQVHPWNVETVSLALLQAGVTLSAVCSLTAQNAEKFYGSLSPTLKLKAWDNQALAEMVREFGSSVASEIAWPDDWSWSLRYVLARYTEAAMINSSAQQFGKAFKTSLADSFYYYGAALTHGGLVSVHLPDRRASGEMRTRGVWFIRDMEQLDFPSSTKEAAGLLDADWNAINPPFGDVLDEIKDPFDHYGGKIRLSRPENISTTVFHPMEDVADGSFSGPGPNTQKVKGFRAMDRVRKRANIGSAVYDPSWRWAFASEVAEADDAAFVDVVFPTFARPCPTVPRHGFVDSRVVKDGDALRALAKEALAQDDKAEIIICGFMDAEWSAIVTPSTFNLGKGTDGATAGRSVTVYGPAASDKVVDELTSKAGIAAGNVPYIETVYRPNKGQPVAVQCRGGPPLAAVQDFVPRNVTVSRVIPVDDDADLLEWEKLIEAAGKEPGTVVWGNGASLASHFCVHAVINDVPVVTTKEPRVGDVLKPSGVPKWTKWDWRRLAKYMDQAERWLADDDNRMGRDNCRDMAKVGVIGLHLAGFPAPVTDAQQRVIAFGVMAAAKGMAAAVMGELRHVRGGVNMPEHTDAVRRALIVKEFVCKYMNTGRYSRDSHYSAMFKVDTPMALNILEAVHPAWTKIGWGGSFGGPKWGAISTGTRNMLRAIQSFRRDPCKARWTKVVAIWNEAVHREHNGGAPALTKFNLCTSHMDQAAAWPVGLLGSVNQDLITPLVYGFKPNEFAKLERTPKFQSYRSKAIRRAVLIRPDSTWKAIRLSEAGEYKHKFIQALIGADLGLTDAKMEDFRTRLSRVIDVEGVHVDGSDTDGAKHAIGVLHGRPRLAKDVSSTERRFTNGLAAFHLAMELDGEIAAGGMCFNKLVITNTGETFNLTTPLVTNN